MMSTQTEAFDTDLDPEALLRSVNGSAANFRGRLTEEYAEDEQIVDLARRIRRRRQEIAAHKADAADARERAGEARERVEDLKVSHELGEAPGSEVKNAREAVQAAEAEAEEAESEAAIKQQALDRLVTRLEEEAIPARREELREEAAEQLSAAKKALEEARQAYADARDQLINARSAVGSVSESATFEDPPEVPEPVE